MVKLWFLLLCITLLGIFDPMLSKMFYLLKDRFFNYFIFIEPQVYVLIQDWKDYRYFIQWIGLALLMNKNFIFALKLKALVLFITSFQLIWFSSQIKQQTFMALTKFGSTGRMVSLLAPIWYLSKVNKVNKKIGLTIAVFSPSFLLLLFQVYFLKTEEKIMKEFQIKKYMVQNQIKSFYYLFGSSIVIISFIIFVFIKSDEDDETDHRNPNFTILYRLSSTIQKMIKSYSNETHLVSKIIKILFLGGLYTINSYLWKTYEILYIPNTQICAIKTSMVLISILACISIFMITDHGVIGKQTVIYVLNIVGLIGLMYLYINWPNMWLYINRKYFSFILIMINTCFYSHFTFNLYQIVEGENSVIKASLLMIGVYFVQEGSKVKVEAEILSQTQLAKTIYSIWIFLLIISICGNHEKYINSRLPTSLKQENDTIFRSSEY